MGRTRIRSRSLVAVLAATSLVALGATSPAASSRDADEKGVTGSRAVAVALDEIRSNPRTYGVSAGDLEHLVVTDSYRSAHNGVTHVYLRQQANDLEVKGADANVNVLPDYTILSAGSRLISDLAARTSGRAVIDARRSVENAAAHLDLRLKESPAVRSRLDDAARTTLLSDAGISLSPIPARLVYQPVPSGAVRLAWELEIEEIGEQHWWNVTVDAETGKVLAKTDYVVHDDVEQTAGAVARSHEQKSDPAVLVPPRRAKDGSSYRVWALPSESPNEGDRRLVKNPADKSTSPFGWHDTDGSPGPEHTTTQGNNAHAYADYMPVSVTPLPFMDAEGGDDLTFDFPIDFDLPPHTWRDAAVTNLFYWNNVIHDVTQRYGFGEAAGNFQVTNYSSPEGDGDHVRAEAQDGSGVNNANFATPPDGSPPRMQMYVWPNVARRAILDGDLDAGIIVHEYGHGISNRLTGGPSNVECLRNQEQAGEGWSDWLAVAYTARRSDKGKPRGMGTYALGQPDRHERGIRPTPYSTDKNINPATYDTIKSAAVPHGVGYVWATMLWEMYWNLVREHGFNPDVYGGWRSGGNNLAIQLVMDGMKLQPCSPGFVDSRDAIIAADVALTGGENRCPIWRAFAKRGLGVNAKQGQPDNRSDGTQDFKLPKGC